MNKQNREQLNKAVEILKGLHFNVENIMVTGSIALDLQGLCPYGRTAHDVDIIIKMDDQTWKCMKLIEAINNADQEDKINNLLKEEYAMARDKMIILNTDDLVLNIWRYNSEWSDLKDNETGVYVANVEHIINAKKSYARPKDFYDINSICTKILQS